MAKQSKTKNKLKDIQETKKDDFAEELIRQLNKEHNEKIAFNLGTDDAPTNIKRWISTGSKQLDCIVSNRLNGGLPEGRIVEIYGGASTGKSHLCFEAAKSTQQHGGIVVYIDTENATSMENLRNMGIDVSHKFVFVQTACTEDIFKVAESTINRARAMTKDVPVTIIWDSVAASSPKAELTGEYDKDSIGLQARAIGKGMRKISNIIGSQQVLFLLINQTRKNIGVMFGDDEITPGGRSIPYAASTRIKITSSGQKQIQDKKGRTVGIKVKAKTIKNKVARPFRECEFQIHFGQGVVEHEELFDLFREYCSTAKNGGVVVGNEVVSVSGTGAWKSFSVIDKETGEVKNEVKFHKPDFAEKVLDLPENKEYFDALLDAALVIKHGVKDHPTYVGINYSDTEEVKSIQALQKEQAK